MYAYHHDIYIYMSMYIYNMSEHGICTKCQLLLILSILSSAAPVACSID